MSRTHRRSVGFGSAFQNNVGLGAAVGAGAFVVNFLLTYVFVSMDGVDGGESETWTYVGNILYNAHFVSSETTGGGSSSTTNFLQEAGNGTDLTSTVPAIVYQLVPVVVLLLAGVIVALQVKSRLDTPSATAAGATVVVGYLVLAVVGTFLFEMTFDQVTLGGTTTMTTAPETLPAIVVVGLGYPIVLGAIGGAIGNEL